MAAAGEKRPAVNKKLFGGFLRHHLNMLPEPYSGQESNKLTLIYFILASADVLGGVPSLPLAGDDWSLLSEQERAELIDFVYSLQIDDADSEIGGWRGSHAFGRSYCSTAAGGTQHHDNDLPHIAMSYVALALLLILGDDFARVRRKKIVASLPALQQPNGSFGSIPGDREGDMRFVYCAAAISYMLDDWSGVDRQRMVDYVLASQSYEGALGQSPGEESHGGSTYTGVAALWLMNELHRLPEQQQLLRWACERQIGGFQGRSNKPADTCYSFWIGASLQLLGHTDLIDAPSSRAFTFSCQSGYGGFAKLPEANPDVLHTYYGLAGLSIAGDTDLLPIHTGLALTQRAVQGLARAQQVMRENEK